MRRPQEPSLLYPKKTKNPNPSPIGNRFGFFLFGGRGWIRTTEAESSRFTVCPHWPLGNTPIFFSQSVPDCLYILPLPRGFVKFFAANYFAGMRAASSQKKKRSRPVSSGLDLFCCSDFLHLGLCCTLPHKPNKSACVPVLTKYNSVSVCR